MGFCKTFNLQLMLMLYIIWAKKLIWWTCIAPKKNTVLHPHTIYFIKIIAVSAVLALNILQSSILNLVPRNFLWPLCIWKRDCNATSSFSDVTARGHGASSLAALCTSKELAPVLRHLNHRKQQQQKTSNTLQQSTQIWCTCTSIKCIYLKV